MNKKEIKKYLGDLCADEIKLLREVLVTEYNHVYNSKNSNHKILNREREN